MTRYPSRIPKLLRFGGGLGGALLTFALLSLLVRKEGILPGDKEVLYWLHSIRSSPLDLLALGITQTASLPFVVLWTSLVLLRHRLAGGFPFLILLAGSEALNLLAKDLVARPRPHLFAPLWPEHGFSFPSGHAMVSLSLVLGLSFLEGKGLSRPPWLLAPGLLWAFLVGLSRLYLQVHYPSDVLASWALALAWFLAFRLYWERQHAAFAGRG